MDKLKVGDRVRIRMSPRIWQVTEVNPKGPGEPAPPSTYLVKIKPVEGGLELVYGDQALVPEGG